MRKIKATAVAAAFLAFSLAAASNAWAAVFTVDSISGEWTNVVGGSSVTNNGVQSNPTAAEIRWGNPAEGNPQSGYDFFSSAPSSFAVNSGDVFSIGTFTHHNNEIALGSEIVSVQLDVLVDINGSGVFGPFLFNFLHVETPNGCSPLPGCANDLVTVVPLHTSTTFSVGEQLYALTILGLSTDGGLSFIDIFSSPEGTLNSADLYAKVSAVPLPAALWMFLTALSALGLSVWRRKQA